MSNQSMRNLKSGQCKWPIGDPKDDDFHFCGDRSHPALPYCDHHAELSRNPGSRTKGFSGKKKTG